MSYVLNTVIIMYVYPNYTEDCISSFLPMKLACMASYIRIESVCVPLYNYSVHDCKHINLIIIMLLFVPS